MVEDMSSYIDALALNYYEALISPSQFSRIKDVTQGLPLLSSGYFECYLGKGQKRVDLNLCIKPDEALYFAQHLKKANNLNTSGNVFYETLKHIVWFCERWSDKRFSIRNFIGDVWIVYDIEPSIANATTPWFYVRFPVNYLCQYPPFKSTLVFQVLNLFAEKISDSLAFELREFLNTLPQDFFVCAIGIKKDRPINTVRFYFVLKRYENIFSLLQMYGWPGDLKDLHQQLDPMAIDFDFFGLAVDLGSGLHPKIGIEFWIEENKVKIPLMNLMDNLVARDLCSDQEKQSFFNWNGLLELQTVPKIWAAGSNKAVVRKNGHYIKLVYDQNRTLFAKAYLLFNKVTERRSEIRPL